MKNEVTELRAALARVHAELDVLLPNVHHRVGDVTLPSASALRDAPTAYARQAARLDAVAEALHELTPMDVDLILGEAPSEPASACEEAAKEAYRHFCANNGEEYRPRLRWEHLSDEAQSLWRALATRVHDTWEAAAGR